MELIGRLTKKFDTAIVSDRFKKREFILTTEENTPYPQPLSMQLTQDKCTALDPYNEDDEIKVNFNIRGRYWAGPQGDKWFNTIDVWRIELVAKGLGQPTVTDNRTQAEKDVEAALVKMSPEARAALQKSLMKDEVKDTSSNPTANGNPIFTGNNDDNDDLPW